MCLDVSFHGLSYFYSFKSTTFARLIIQFNGVNYGYFTI